MNHDPRALFLSHGGGPLPLLGDATHAQMVSCLQKIAAEIARPSAIILISAHWEADPLRVTAAASPELIYDYKGFPPASYDIEYPCPGTRSLAADICQQLENAGIDCIADQTRGLDHGVFVPLKILYPQADIPCVQLSLQKGLDPLRHIELGAALRGLDDPSLLVVGSGFTFHNMRAFFSPASHESVNANVAFENWLIDTCVNPEVSEEQRIERFLNWSSAPSARYCHPREEHLMPLLVCYGYAGSAATKTYQLEILHKKTSMYSWHC